MQAVFHTNKYEFSHGRLPRGRGGWAFDVRCQSPRQYANLLNPQQHGIVRAEPHPDDSEFVRLWVRESCTYTEAKARVTNFLRVHFTVANLTVCP